jgi:CRP-like cAMP-binding protein
MWPVATITDAERATLLANPWFASLATPALDDFMHAAQRRSLAHGEVLYRRGEDSREGLFIVLGGSVRISGTSPEGREAVFTFIQPGNLFAEVSMFDGGPRSHDATAHLPTELLAVSAAKMESLLAKHPDLCRKFLTLANQRLRLVMTMAESHVNRSLEQRFAARLATLALVYGSKTTGGVEISLHLPQETLGQLAGASRQRVNQLLKEWEAEGLIAQHYGRILIRDLERLEKIASPFVII